MSFKFIDLFAGIGGFHLAMHRLGGKCVFASEIDEHARKTYITNFSGISPELFEEGRFNDDIRKINPEEIPDFDVLCAGFPCQPFSQAGLRKGFEDNQKSERGNLFFYIAEIIKTKRPKAFFLENVRGLLNHDNGNTLKVIQNILETELGYSFIYKIIRASDFGLPQHRPRLLMVGFRDDSFMSSFSFPDPIPLKLTMSDIWGAKCNRDIGFTLRVGGRGSHIDDRRNWDHYLVNDEVRRIGSIQAKKMQGFPDTFILPVSETQAMKQLGNSVAINAIEAVGSKILQYLNHTQNNVKQDSTMIKNTKNKGEWSELLVFLKCLIDRKIYFGDRFLTASKDKFNITKVSNQNIDYDLFLNKENIIQIINKENKKRKVVYNTDEKLNRNLISILINKIQTSKGTFEMPEFQEVQSFLGLEIIKGGDSNQKQDINLSIQANSIDYENQGFSIKSYLGSKATLLNASGNTNFIFKVNNISEKLIDHVNTINTKHKLIDRISFIIEQGGDFEFIGAEKDVMQFNLKMIDSDFPKHIGKALILFYMKRINNIKDVVAELTSTENIDDKTLIQEAFKRFLIAILLGMFAGKKWDGNYDANGALVLKTDGDLLGYHIIRLSDLKEFLYNNIKFDTPSTSRHMFGSLFKESDGHLYFKLNMQLRF